MLDTTNFPMTLLANIEGVPCQTRDISLSGGLLVTVDDLMTNARDEVQVVLDLPKTSSPYGVSYGK